MDKMIFPPNVAREIVKRLSLPSGSPSCPLCGLSSCRVHQTRGGKQYRRCPRCGLNFPTIKIS